MKKLLFALLTMILLVSCARASDTVSHNISRAADEFRVLRRVIFYNGITDTYILELIGYCSINVNTTDGDLSVTCKIGPDKYQKHFLGLSDNVTYTVEQLDDSNVSEYKYQLIFKPKSIIPVEIEVKN